MLELANYNHANREYLDVKMAMLKQDKLPFQADDFFKPEKSAAKGGASSKAVSRKATFMA